MEHQPDSLATLEYSMRAVPARGILTCPLQFSGKSGSIWGHCLEVRELRRKPVLQAILGGKLSTRHEGSEDLLVSSTFGLLKYVSAKEILLPFLGAAIDPFAKRNLKQAIAGLERVERFRFWPWFEEAGCKGCEPDVEIVLTDGKRRFALLVEAKFRSGKSSWGNESGKPNDQLARQFDNLASHGKAEGFDGYAVIYLTADFSCPTTELLASHSDFKRHRHDTAELYWLSWHQLSRILEQHDQAHEVISDMLAMLRRLGLTPRSAFRFDLPGATNWRFTGDWTPGVTSKPDWKWGFSSFHWHFGGKAASGPELSLTVTAAKPSLLAIWQYDVLPNLRQFYRWDNKS
jgi:hypothetical protein